MARNPDILFMTEYIKNVIYFATTRTGKTLTSTSETHYFSIDNELEYENYYSDFGPLNLGCVYKYCKILNDKLKQYLNKQTIVHYTSNDPKKKANAAFLLGCYGVLYLSLSPKDSLKPLLVNGQSYRPFQDATQGDSSFTISLQDCLLSIKKARELGLFNFQDFNYEEYDRLDKIQGGDLNWIIPGKFLAFIGPVDYSVSLYHPPEMYIDYFIENNVKIVIRLNKRLYDGKVFNNAGIVHYDLFFPDGSCPPRHILQKFLQISEESDGALAVHCKAGLGRTGSLIGCYLMKHYRMTAREAIGWMRICRPGSVIGHQQAWLEQLEAWLIKQGNLYRKRTFNDTEKLPVHLYGVYSIAEKTMKQRPVVFYKSPSPPPPKQRMNRTDMPPSPLRPQASKLRNDMRESEDEEVFLTSCDLTIKPAMSMTQIKGCIIRNNTITEENDDITSNYGQENDTHWKRLLCCNPCIKTFQDAVWTISVRCARVAPGTCYSNRFCGLLDMVSHQFLKLCTEQINVYLLQWHNGFFLRLAVNKTEKEKEQSDWRVKPTKLNVQKTPNKGELNDINSAISRRTSPGVSRRGSGAGEPRLPRSHSRSSLVRGAQVNNVTADESYGNPITSFNAPITTFRSSNGPVIKNVNDAKKYLMRSSIHNEERERQLKTSLTITPHSPPNYVSYTPSAMAHITPSGFSTVSRNTQPHLRRRLGRSPSPPQARMSNEHTRATNTPNASTTTHKFLANDASKSALRDALSRLKLTTHRDGSVGKKSLGAASLGARREAPSPKIAPSVRSDERPLATQGDMLNSIKFQRRLRQSLQNEKQANVFASKPSTLSREKAPPVIIKANSRTSTGTRQSGSGNQEFTYMRTGPIPRSFSPVRPSSPSPKGKRTPSFY